MTKQNKKEFIDSVNRQKVLKKYNNTIELGHTINYAQMARETRLSTFKFKKCLEQLNLLVKNKKVN